MIETPNNLRDNEAQQGYDFCFFPVQFRWRNYLVYRQKAPKNEIR